MNWFVIYTRSRCEKAVAEKLSLIGVQVYCPLLRTKKLWSDRWKWVEEPLFRSYCFVYLDDSEKEKVLLVPGVVRYLYHCGKPAIVRDREMEQLKSWLMEYDHAGIHSNQFNVRDRILIRSGALINRQAEVVDSSSNYALLYLESIGLQVRVDLRKNILEKLETC